MLNEHSGCLDRHSVQYDPTATYEPTSSSRICDEDIAFGGTYATTIECTQNNTAGQCMQSFYPCFEYHVLTNDWQCPLGFQSRTAYTTANPWFNLTECSTNNTASIRSALLFGGAYSASHTDGVNPVTAARSCPQYFTPISLYDCDANVVCVSQANNEKALGYAVPFGGFKSSCISVGVSSCPDNYYSKHTVNVYDKCTLSYCAKLKRKELWPLEPLTTFQFVKAVQQLLDSPPTVS